MEARRRVKGDGPEQSFVQQWGQGRQETAVFQKACGPCAISGPEALEPERAVFVFDRSAAAFGQYRPDSFFLLHPSNFRLGFCM